jgi:hypothetical protein
MLKILALSALLLMACNSTDPDGGPALAGVYQFEEILEGDVYTNQVEFGAGSSFKARSWYEDVDEVYCQGDEAVGKWSLAGDKITLTERKSRARETGLCSDDFSAFEELPVKVLQIRNLAAGTFEIYSDGDSDVPGYWVKYTKL